MPISPKDLKSQTICWRDRLAVHPAAEAYPLLLEKELKQLAGDIRRNDLRADFVLWRPDDKTEPVLLDGRNRLDALALHTAHTNGQITLACSTSRTNICRLSTKTLRAASSTIPRRCAPLRSASLRCAPWRSAPSRCAPL